MLMLCPDLIVSWTAHDRLQEEVYLISYLDELLVTVKDIALTTVISGRLPAGNLLILH